MEATYQSGETWNLSAASFGRAESRERLLQELEPCLAEQLKLIPSVSKVWQPSDFLPLDGESPSSWARDFRESCRGICPEIIVVLAGNAITEEALPSYSAALRRVDGMRQMPGDASSPWMQWSRAWAGEENRHGELLTRFLLLSGRVRGSEFERAIQTLIRNGFDTRDDADPIRTFVYSAFQERATKISHINISCSAENAGASLLARICRVIAADEARHEEIYVRVMEEVFKLCPTEALAAYAEMMRLRIVMPARLMGEGNGVKLFDAYSRIAEELGVYTAEHYVAIVEHLNARWHIPDMQHLSDNAAAQQEYLCELPNRMRRALRRKRPCNALVTEGLFDWLIA
jgi:acyl-[acyl-carrier-protein] desaturase